LLITAKQLQLICNMLLFTEAAAAPSMIQATSKARALTTRKPLLWVTNQLRNGFNLMAVPGAAICPDSQATPIATTPSQHLPQSFFARPAELVAPELIGCLLVTNLVT